MSSSALLLLIPLLRAPPAVFFDGLLPLLVRRQELGAVGPDDAAKEYSLGATVGRAAGGGDRSPTLTESAVQPKVARLSLPASSTTHCTT